MLQESRPDLAEISKLRRAEFEVQRDIQHATDLATALHHWPWIPDLLEKHVPLRAYDHRCEPGRHIEGVPFQTITPAEIMEPPPPAVDDMDTTEDLESAPDVVIEPSSPQNTSPSKKSTSVQKVKGESHRKVSSIKPKSKAKPQPSVSPRRKVLVKRASEGATTSKSASSSSGRKGKARQLSPEQQSDSEVIDAYDDDDDGDGDDDDDDDDGDDSPPVKRARPQPEEILRDYSDVTPWGVPQTDSQKAMENARALAMKNWHLIEMQDCSAKKQDGEGRNTRRKVRGLTRKLDHYLFLTPPLRAVPSRISVVQSPVAQKSAQLHRREYIMYSLTIMTAYTVRSVCTLTYEWIPSRGISMSRSYAKVSLVQNLDFH